MTPALGRAALKELAARYGVRPSKALGQNFLADPNLARAIAAEANGDHVIEIGAGLGSLTTALSSVASDVLAIEFDRAIIPALREVVAALPNVEVLEADATKLDWSSVLGDETWTLCANLPYNIGTSLVEEVLDRAPRVCRLVVLVQREVGERFVASPGQAGYGPVSVKVEYHSEAALVRRVPARAFWPMPKVDSVVVRIERRAHPAVDSDPGRLWTVVEAGFAQRRKTIGSAMRNAGIDDRALAASGVDPLARAEDLSIDAFARLAEALP